jgi:hypothetical protein
MAGAGLLGVARANCHDIGYFCHQLRHLLPPLRGQIRAPGGPGDDFVSI